MVTTRPADSRAGEQERQRWARIAISAADSIRAEMSRLEPEAPKLSAHLHLHDQAAPELAAVLGARLAELARAGLLEDAAALLSAGAPELDPEIIKAVAVDTPKEQSVSMPAPESTDPRPPPSADQRRGT